MSEAKMGNDYMVVKRYIDSCETEAQFHVARRIFSRFNKMYKDELLTNGLWISLSSRRFLLNIPYFIQGTIERT